jgi:hypothetical protein
MKLENKGGIIGEDFWEFEANIKDLARRILHHELSVDFREEHGRPDIKSVRVVDDKVVMEFSTFKNTEQY